MSRPTEPPPGGAPASPGVRLLRADSRRTRETILDQAFQVLTEQPEATLEQIALAVGVNRSTVHRHFPRRDDLIRALTHRIVPEMDACFREAEAAGGSYGDQFERLFRLVVLRGDRLRFLLAHWREEYSDLDLYETADDWMAMVDGAQREGSIRHDLPVEWILLYYGATIDAAFTIIEAGTLSAEEAADVGAATFIAGLSPP